MGVEERNLPRQALGAGDVVRVVPGDELPAGGAT